VTNAAKKLAMRTIIAGTRRGECRWRRWWRPPWSFGGRRWTDQRNVDPRKMVRGDNTIQIASKATKGAMTDQDGNWMSLRKWRRISAAVAARLRASRPRGPGPGPVNQS